MNNMYIKKDETDFMVSETDAELLKKVSKESEVVKVSCIYPDLRSQALYAMKDIAKAKEEISEQIKMLIDSSGDFAAKALIRSIYSEFIDKFMDGNANKGDGEQEVTVSREELYHFAFDTYSKIEAADILTEIKSKFDTIRKKEDLLELTDKKVLW